MKNILLIINPAAGKMKSKTALFDIINAFCKENYNVNVSITQHTAHAKELAKEAVLLNKYDFLVCSGGDGTLNEVINGMMSANGKKLPIGYIPAGSTNDFASTMCLPLNIKKCAETIACGNQTSLDIGLFDDEYFSYIASFGAFTATSYQTPQINKNTLGHLAYILEGLKDLTQIKPYKVKITADGKVFEDNYIFGAITNTTSIGGFLKLKSELVKLNDGVFEVILIKNPHTPLDIQQLIYGITNSDFSNSNLFEFFKASSLTVETNEPFDWSLDGEHKTGKNKIQIKNLKEMINLIK